MPIFRHSRLRHVEPVQPVKNATRFLGPDQVVVNLPRGGQCIGDRLFGDFVEHQPVDGDLGLEHFLQMPTDRFPLAIFVRREVQVVGLFEGIFELLDLLLLVGGHDVERLEIVLDVDAQVCPSLVLELLGDIFFARREVTHVPDARLDLVTRAEKL